MLSKHHLLLSIATGAALVFLVPPAYSWWVVVGFATVLGVGIDVDHFLIARLNQGDWRATVRGIRNPRLLFFDQANLFPEDALWARQRLLSHAIIGSLVVAALVLVAPWMALIAAVTLWVHFVSDIVWDNYFIERDFRQHARYLGFDA